MQLRKPKTTSSQPPKTTGSQPPEMTSSQPSEPTSSQPPETTNPLPKPFSWKKSFVSTLEQHLRLLSVLVTRIRDHDLESEQYHFLNFSLTFMAGRMVPVDDVHYIISVHPQAPLRAPRPVVDRAQPVAPDAVHGPLTRNIAARIGEALERGEMDDPTVAMFGGHHELDPGLPSGFDPLAETSFTTDVTEVSQGVPKEEVRSPDFATVISFLPTGDELEYEEHILFLHEVKRYPPGYFELKAKARSDAVWGIMEDTVKQAAEQAYRVFNEYLDDDVVRVMLHVGIWFCTVTFDRKQTEKLVPRFVTEPSSSDNWQSVPTRVSEVHSMYNIAVYDDECIGVEEYGQQFKERMTKARKARVKAYEEKHGLKSKGQGAVQSE